MTSPAQEIWHPVGTHRRSEVSAVIGQGADVFERAARDVFMWRVKTRSAFRVASTDPAPAGERLVITARVLGITITEPVEVVEVVETADRVGFSYRTLPGHPVDGEEAFIVSRDGDAVTLTEAEGITGDPATSGIWRMLYPLLCLAQVVARRRYLRALVS